MVRMRNFVFTLNNYDEDDEQRIQDSEFFAYVVYGREVAPRTGTPHLQGYVELRNPASFDRVRREFAGRAHIQPRRGTASEASVYCKKGDDFYERGNCSHQGARRDLDGAREAAQDGGMRLVSSVYNAQAIRVAEKYLTYNEEVRDFKPNVEWWWGPTEVGKSKGVRAAALLLGFKPDQWYTKNVGDHWFDGYDGHPVVILDDFRGDWWRLHYMLGFLDRYEFRVQYKGGHRQMRATHIFITSDRPPQECYEVRGMDQLLRRIDIVRHLE